MSKRRSPQEQTAWLASIEEPALNPDLEIIDSHVHLGSHMAIPYLLPELGADIGRGLAVQGVVNVECGWDWTDDASDPLRTIAEVRNVRRLAEVAERDGGVPVLGIIGHVDLRHGEVVRDTLDTMVAESDGRLVGIRHATAWDDDPAVLSHRTCAEPRLMSDLRWREGLAALASAGLVYDAWLYHPQIPELTDLATAFPEATIVLDHLGGPLAIGRYRNRVPEVAVEALESLRALAACLNVNLKLGGVGMTWLGADWHRGDAVPTSESIAARWRTYVLACIDLFGPGRCMFESNFPLDRFTTPYGMLWNVYNRITEGFSADERRSLFSETARHVYRLRP